MATIADTIYRYEAAWNETDPAKRMALLETCWLSSGIYTDPDNQAHGRAALSDCMGNFHQAQPGATLKVTTGVDEHHGQVRIQWLLFDPQGNEVMEGTSFGEIGADGSISRMTGFFGPFPARAAG